MAPSYKNFEDKVTLDFIKIIRSACKEKHAFFICVGRKHLTTLFTRQKFWERFLLCPQQIVTLNFGNVVKDMG